MSDFTQADYDALNKAIASGVMSVRFADRTVQYRSMDEMLRVRHMMAEELGVTRRPNRVLASFDKGLAK